MASFSARFVDIREGEGRIAAHGFGVLFLVIGAHTLLETARDVIFLTELPARQLNEVYVIIAALSFLSAWFNSWLTRRLGRQHVLTTTIVAVALLTLLFHRLPPTPFVARAFYVFSGLIGGLLPTQFWTLAADLFTVAQGRRLFNALGAGGVVGGLVGATAAALVLRHFPVQALLPIASFVFLISALLLSTLPSDRRWTRPRPPEDAPNLPVDKARSTFRESPFLSRLALLVALSTGAVLVVDYLFKSSAARYVPHAQLGEFFARYYAILNAGSLLVQLFVAGKFVSRLGVVGAAAVMPLMLTGAGIGSALTGGFAVILLAKGIDGGFRYSLNRVATELLYLAVPARLRDRGKAFIDTVLMRLTQALTAGVLLALATSGLATPRVLSFIVAGLSGAWLFVAVTLRRPYLDLFRGALRDGTMGLSRRDLELDELGLESAEAAVEALASRHVDEVIAAMDLLSRLNHGRIIPALVLYHDDPRVVAHALEIFADSNRKDWFSLGERLLADPRDDVRLAAVRALTRAGRADVALRMEHDTSAEIRGYAALQIARTEPSGALKDHPKIHAVVAGGSDDADAARLGIVHGISDVDDPRAVDLLLYFVASRVAAKTAAIPSLRMVCEITRTVSKMKDPRFVPYAIQRLSIRVGRVAIREMLVAIGDPALDALLAALYDPTTPRTVKLHIPRSIAWFGSQRACDILTRAIVDAGEGLVRYKALRGLGRLVFRHDVKVDRRAIEREAQRNLLENLRMSAYRSAIDAKGTLRGAPPISSDSGQLLDELLDDKYRQALDRAFRLLEIAYRREDIRRVRIAVNSTDRRAKANAAEFIDALLSKRGERTLRDLFRTVIDDVPERERAARATAWIRDVPASRTGALERLMRDRDEVVALMAAYCALSLDDPALSSVVAGVRSERPSLAALGERFFGEPARTLGVANG